MAWYLVIVIFLASCIFLSWLSSRLIKSLISIAKYLHWREFIIAFFVMAFAVSLPNLFTDINAVLQGKPELAFGDIIGGNLVDLTLILAIATFFSGKKGIEAESKMVQQSAVFTTIIAVLPLLLAFDGTLHRHDGFILIIAFLLYAWWIFSKKERFQSVYKNGGPNILKNYKIFLLDLLKIVVLIVLLLMASQAVVWSAQYFSSKLGISLALVGILIVGLGNAFPEAYFAIVSAREGKNWLVLGDLMGSVIVCSTLVLGVIGILWPFEIKDLSPFINARLFLIVASVLSLIFIKSHKRITQKEGFILLFIYIIFLLVEVFIN